MINNKEINTISVRVRYAETDQMGIVYHANYAQYLELGRIAWLKQLGFSYKKMEEDGIILPVISLSLNYKRSATYDDKLTIVTKLVKKPTVKIAFDYQIFNEDNQLLVEANTVLAFLNAGNRKPIKCPAAILDQLDSN